MKISLKLENQIKQAYSDLLDIGITSRINIRLDNDRILDYPVFNDLIIRDRTEDDCLFMEDRVNVVIRITSKQLFTYSINHTEIPATKEMKKTIGGTVTRFWKDDVNAILLTNEGAYCFGKTLSTAVKRCKVINDVVKEYYTHHMS